MIDLFVCIWFWIMGSYVVWAVAESRGRNGFGWAMLGFFLISPVLAYACVVGMPPITVGIGKPGE